MSQPLQFTTTVLPGGQIQLPPGAANAGQTVEVTVVPKPQPSSKPAMSLLEFLNSLPPGPRGVKTWEELDEHIQEERNSWDR
jgi:hypothetical protein